MIGGSISFEVDNLMLTFRIEVQFRRGIFITWTVFDAHQDDERRFLRRGSAHADECDEDDLAERFRKAG